MPVIRLAQARARLDRLDPEVLFSDVDGTLVGRGGSLLAAFDGTPTAAAAQALVDVHRSGLRVVLVSGRTRADLRHTGRLLGIRDAIAELGAVLVIDGSAQTMWGQAPQDAGETPADALRRAGVLGWLLNAFGDRLEPHGPAEDREGTIPLRGRVEPKDADAALAEAGFGWACLRDNGRFNRPLPRLGLGPGRAHAYHLAPKGVTKAATARAYLRQRGLSRMQAAAIGDAPSDLDLAQVVGAMFLVANGAWALDDPAVQETAIVTDGSAGEGWAQAVHALLADRSADQTPASSPARQPPAARPRAQPPRRRPTRHPHPTRRPTHRGLLADSCFFSEVGLLKRSKRTGWWLEGVKDPESIAERSFRTAVIGCVLALWKVPIPASPASAREVSQAV